MRDQYCIHGLNLEIKSPYKTILNEYRRSLTLFKADDLSSNSPTLRYYIGDFTSPDELTDMKSNKYGKERTLLWRPLAFPKAMILLRNISGKDTEIKMTKWYRALIGGFLGEFFRLKFLNMGYTYQHCASVSKNGYGILLPAFGHVGKTTLSYYMLFKEGFDYMGDDDTIITPEGYALSMPTELGFYYTTIKENKIKLTRKKMWNARFKYIISKIPQKWIYTSEKIHPWEILNKDVNPKMVDKAKIKKLFLLERGNNQIQLMDKSEAIKKMLASTLHKEHEAVKGLLYSYSAIDPDFDLIDLHAEEKNILQSALKNVDCYKLTFDSFNFAIKSIKEAIK